MGFSIDIIDLYLFSKHIALNGVEVGQNMRENLSCPINNVN